MLRCFCWQTKTVSNFTWGLIGNGFLSHGSCDWLYRFLRTHFIYHQQAGNMTIDFLFPSCLDEGVRFPLQAMEYPECLYFFRKYLQIFWHEGSTDALFISSKSCTVHGPKPKTTMLSFANANFRSQRNCDACVRKDRGVFGLDNARDDGDHEPHQLGVPIGRTKILAE